MINKRWINIMRGLLSTAPLRHALFTLFIAGILSYGAGFAGYMLAKFDLINLIREMSNDDSFYYFQIAYHLSEGKFSTFDGGITRTNGYHPLWMFAVTPFYWVFDKESALFGIKAFEIMLVAGAVACIATAARLARLPWILLFAALPLLYEHRASFGGLEAAAALFMLGLFMLALMLYARNPARWTWPLAAVAFALPWVRLEYIAISMAATVVLCVIEWSRRERPAGAWWRSLMLSAPSQALVLIGGAIAGILVYFLYNRLVFGGIVPVSGVTKAAWSQFKWAQAGGYSFTQNFRDVLQVPVFDFELLAALAICAGLLLVWWLARRSRDERDWLLLVFLVGAFGLAVGHLSMFAQTVLTVYPTSQGKFLWYFVPAYLMMALITPVICYVAIYFIRRCIGPRWRRTAGLLSVSIIAAGAVFLLARADFTYPFWFVENYSAITRNHDEWVSSFYGGVQVMNRVLPDNSVVGSWDAGIVGYFSRFPVVNLDGLVNSYDYLHDTGVAEDGYASWKNKFIPLYREFGITGFANITTQHFAGDVILETSSPSQGDRFYIFPAEPLDNADTAEWFWQRMEPHFAYQSDGVGFIVDGRLAQGFARNCAPGELAVWEWGGPGNVVGMNWHRNESGLCMVDMLLPHHAMPPVGIAALSASDYLAALIGSSAPAISSDYAVYLKNNRLIYVNEQCGDADVARGFFLHLDPVRQLDLPRQRRPNGFDNLDFRFAWNGRQFGEICIIIRQLPDYDIAAIRTGQFERVGGNFSHVWEGKIRPE